MSEDLAYDRGDHFQNSYDDSYRLAGTFSSFPPLQDSAPLKPGEERPKPEPKRITPTLKPRSEKS